MSQESQTRVFLKEVREAVLAESKGRGLLSKLFKGKKDVQEEGLTGLEVTGYRIGEVLGQGAAGVVFAATDPKGNEVAVKVLPKPPESDKSAATIFEREVKIGQTIDHPAIVQTLHTFELGPAQFVVMERVSGHTLKKSTLEALPLDRFLAIFQPLAEGLDAAHAKGVVHRDLKPENVMLTEDGTVKILDFGMARLMQDASVTATGTFKGTIRYTSPEQIADSKRVGPACDQFAFALMCFEALTGDFPFLDDEKNPMGTIMARVQEKPKTLSAVDSKFSPEASEVMGRMLAADPDARYPTVTEGFEALKRSLGH